ncbi:MAG: hypothetical protein MJZ96_04650 [Paludibacteraceae bacterium]|nr:hypothetical protein [Paludibacteraceae bacterium]
MDKEILTTLISRDLDDLRKLVDGFLQLPQCPEPLVQLAADKAEILSANLLLLLKKEEEQENPNEPEVEIEFIFEPEEEQNEVEQSIECEADGTEEALEHHSVEEPVVEMAEETPAEEVVEPEQPLDEVVEPEQPQEDVAETPVEEEKPEPSPRHPIFVDTQDKSLGGAFLNRPVEDLKKAISLADRFRFIRELFNGNGELMSTTIDELNALTSFEEVEVYLSKHFPQWDGDNSAVVDFINIVSRKF